MSRLCQGAVGLAAAVAIGACSAKEPHPREFPDLGPGGKTDALGRKLIGLPSDYEPADLDKDVLVADARLRREAAWATAFKVLEPVPLLGLAESSEEHEEIELEDGEMPQVPRFQTWYGVDDVKVMFQHLYEGLDPSDRAVRAPFSEEALEDAVKHNASRLDRSKRWPLERYIEFVRDLGICTEEMTDEECVNLVQARFGGAVSGNARILYSPGTVDHVLRNYGSILDCLDALDELEMGAEPADEENFTLCFDDEFPERSVLVKAQWARADFDRTVPAYDTDAEAMTARLAGTAHWGEEGDRRADPSPSDIYTVRLRGGDTYRLVGLHIMTKELRHWQWITLWWSDQPRSDFGADRPARIRDQLPPVWRNYKMCAVDFFVEEDPDPAARYPQVPSLAEALAAVHRGAGGPTWCSNPYIEHGRNNGRTNCIGCHQHGGATVAFDLDEDGALDPIDLEEVIRDETHFPEAGRRQIREVFPADYLFSMNRVDDFAHVIQSEVRFFDDVDEQAVRARIQQILTLEGDAEAGETVFSDRCAGCHGPSGGGTLAAPNLGERVPTRDDESIVQTLLQGRGGMPSWSDVFSDQEIADLLAFLRQSFGG